MKDFKAICAQGGVEVLLHREIPGDRCPCFDAQMGVKSLQWHRDNPGEPECSPDGYLSGSWEDKAFNAFLEPASKKQVQVIQRIFGEVKAHDLYYMGPADVDLRALNRDRDYVLFEGEKYKVLNPELLYLMGRPHHYEAGLRRRD